MKTQTQKANILTNMALLAAFVPFIGLPVSMGFIIVALILASIGANRDQKRAVRVMMSAILAAPVCFLLQTIMLFILSQLG